MRFYIAGPMRGRPQLNKHSFDYYAETLRSYGHEVFNPWTDEGEWNRPFFKDELHGYMCRDLNAIAFDVDAVFLMPEWHTSKGAVVERFYAHYLGIPVITYDGFVLHFNNLFQTHGHADGEVTAVIPPSYIFASHETLASVIKRAEQRPFAVH